MKKNNFYLDWMMELTLQRVVIVLALVFIFIFLPLYLFSVEPYDPKPEEITLIKEEESAINLKITEKIETKKLNDDASPSDSVGYAAENLSIENTMPSIALSAKKTVKKSSGHKLNYIYNTTEDKDHPSVKISAEIIENKEEGKTENALSYDELSQNVIANKPAEIETQKNNSFKIEDSEVSGQRTDKRFSIANKKELDELNQIEMAENQAKEKIEKSLSSDKLFRESEIKRLVQPALKITHSREDQHIKIEHKKKKITNIKSHRDNIKEKRLVNDIKSSTKLSTKRKVSRALLAKTLIDNEPLNIIKPPVIVSENIMTKLYFFTEIINMKGKALYHYWMWEGNIEFEKEIKISGNRWRAASLKMIPYSKTGLWQARLVSEDGDILNQIEFEVIKE